MYAEETSLPRYKLKVGQEFYYEVRNDFVTRRGEGRRLDQWHIWVVKRNGDGSWRLVLRNWLGKAGKRGEALQVGGSKHVRFGHLDIHGDGRINPASKSADVDIEFQYFLPLLPEDETEAQRGWERFIVEDGLRDRYSVHDSKS